MVLDWDVDIVKAACKHSIFQIKLKSGPFGTEKISDGGGTKLLPGTSLLSHSPAQPTPGLISESQTG